METTGHNTSSLWMGQRLILLAFAALVLSGHAMAQAFGPVLPLSSGIRDNLLLEEAVRDPAAIKSGVSDDLYAEQTADEIRTLKEELPRTKLVRREEVLRDLYINHVQLAYFYADVVSGRRQSNNGKDAAVRNLAAARQGAIAYAAQFAKLTKNKSEKARAVYHAVVMNYLSGRGRTAAVKQLNDILKFLSVPLKKRANMIIAAEDAARKPGAAIFNKYVATGNVIGDDARVASRLSVARSLAKHKDKAYKGHLSHAVAASAKLGPEQKAQVFAYAISIWRTGEGPKGSWQAVPFNLKVFADMPVVNGLRERMALDDWGNHRGAKAISQYRALIARYDGDPQVLPLERRVLDMELAMFKETKNLKNYEAALLRAEAKYRNPQALGAGREAAVSAAHEEFTQRYRNLVYSAIKVAKKADARPTLRQQAISIATTYQNNAAAAPEKEGLSADVAGIYALNKQHAEAVQIYMDLVINSKSNKNRQYLLAAIQSQRQLADWPQTAPWDKIPAGDAAARTSLLDMYGRLQSMAGKDADWDIVAHQGLLMVSLGQAPEAFKLWQGALQKQPQGNHANAAMGFMMAVYGEQKNWQGLEDLARLAIKARMSPKFRGKAINPVAVLGDALYNGGREALAANNFKLAVAKLVEFTKTYPSDKRRDEGLFMLAFAHRGAGNHADSIATLIALVKEYPNSKRLKEALIHGGDWAVVMAFEEETIFFDQTFVNRFPNDAETPAIRRTLASLYLGRSLYGNASALFYAQSQSAQESPESRLEGAVNYMLIEYRYGDMETAVKGAQYVLKNAGNASGAKAQSYAILARAAQRGKAFGELTKIEGTLASLDASNQDVAEALAEVRMMIAENYARSAQQDVFSLGMTDPMGTLKKHYGYFAQAKVNFDRVCDAGPTSSCAPATFRLAQVANETLAHIDEMQIADTLAKETVDAFNGEKAKIIDYISDVARQSDSKAVALTKEGNTSPLWTSQIMWTNSYDWNFDRVSGETGNGYVQWSPVSLSAPTADQDAEAGE